ncbi:uncharacterized protein [Amphiura filiformis]|uniref:uncharacterized protein n=1 Tax=Amphiura filiformis TaxID=82378 RepID=UPI003B21EE57
MLKRRLPPSQNAPPPVKPQVVEEPVRAQQNNPVMMEPAKGLENLDKNEHSNNKKVVVEVKPSQSMQVAPPHDVGKFPASSTTIPRVENKSHQELKAAYNTSSHVVASPTPSISSSKGASRSVCIPLSMEPMDLGITFGNVNISEVLKEELAAARQDSPVDKLLAGADSVSGLPQVPSTGHSCTDLETAWRDENVSVGEAGDAMTAGNQRVSGVQMTAGGDGARGIGNFNYYEVADMLMKAWLSTLEQKAANPSKVQYYIDDACI